METFTKDFLNVLLGFGEDWIITSIETDQFRKEVLIEIKCKPGSYKDPNTGELAKLYDHTEERIWRHLDIWNYKTYIKTRIPRVICHDGKVRQISLDWADKHGRHTYDFESMIIMLLQATHNQTKTAQIARCGFRVVNRIMHSATERGLQRRNLSLQTIEHISIDEKSFKKGHNYVTVISHPKHSIVLNVGENRDQHSTEELLKQTFNDQQLTNMNTVTMDMWRPYIGAVKGIMPDAEIVHDKFHLIKYLNNAIDHTRRREINKHDLLKNSRYVLLKNQENLTQKQLIKYQTIKDANLQVTQAMGIREIFKSLFDYQHDQKGARQLLENWAKDSLDKSIKEINKVVQMFLNHSTGVINALISGLNNAMAERLNGKIQEVKMTARGYRRFENFRSAILFFNGGLNLFPRNW